MCWIPTRHLLYILAYPVNYSLIWEGRNIWEIKLCMCKSWAEPWLGLYPVYHVFLNIRQKFSSQKVMWYASIYGNSFFIFVLVNTASFSVLFEHTLYSNLCKAINFSCKQKSIFSLSENKDNLLDSNKSKLYLEQANKRMSFLRRPNVQFIWFNCKCKFFL